MTDTDSTLEEPKTPPKKSRLRRAVSQNSVATHEGNQEYQTQDSITELVKTAKRIITNAKKHVNIPRPLLVDLRDVAKILSKIGSINTECKIEQTRQEALSEETNKRLDDHRAIIEKMTDRIPKAEDIQHAVAEGVAQNINALQEHLASILKENTLAIPHEVPNEVPHDPIASRQSPERSPTRSNNAQDQQNNTPKFNDRRYEHPDTRTLVIKPITETPGHEIMKDLKGIHVPNFIVEKTTPKRRTVEIRCCTKEKKDILKRELQSHRQLNRKYHILDVPIRKYKLILSGIQEIYNQEYIKNSLVKKYNIYEEEANPIHSFPNKRGGRNWLLEVNLDLAKALIDSDGLYIGPFFVHIRPFTSVQRCRKCQELGHLAKWCKSRERCSNCSEIHDNATPCTRPKCCINCLQHNEDENTLFPTNHQPSFSSCHTYKKQFNQRKDLLNRIFNLTTHPPERPPLLPNPAPDFINGQGSHQDFPPLAPSMQPWMAPGNPYYY